MRRNSHHLGVCRQHGCTSSAKTDMLHVPAGSGQAIQRQSIEIQFDQTKDREPELQIKLLVSLVKDKAFSSEDFTAGLEGFTKQLEDLRWVMPCWPAAAALRQNIQGC